MISKIGVYLFVGLVWESGLVFQDWTPGSAPVPYFLSSYWVWRGKPGWGRVPSSILGLRTLEWEWCASTLWTVGVMVSRICHSPRDALSFQKSRKHWRFSKYKSLTVDVFVYFVSLFHFVFVERVKHVNTCDDKLRSWIHQWTTKLPSCRSHACGHFSCYQVFALVFQPPKKRTQ